MAGAIMEKVWGLFGMDPAEDKEDDEVDNYELDEEVTTEEEESEQEHGEKGEGVARFVATNKQKQTAVRHTRHWDHITDVRHARTQFDKPLQAQAPARVGRRTVATQIQVPVQSLRAAARRVLGRQQPSLEHRFLQHVVVFFSHAASDDLPLIVTSLRNSLTRRGTNRSIASTVSFDERFM